MDIIKVENEVEEKRKQLIYELMIGAYDLEKVEFPESKIVEDEFEEGKPCSELYGHVCDANKRICERLGVQEDKDVEIIINCMDDICRILAMKMYDYGMKREELCQPGKEDGPNAEKKTSCWNRGF